MSDPNDAAETGTKRTDRHGPDTAVNVHVFSAGCPEIDRMVGFRDRGLHGPTCGAGRHVASAVARCSL